MKHVSLIEQFREDIIALSRQVEAAVKPGHLTINKVCEDLFCELFKELIGLKNLRNLNHDEAKDFPGIDLADDEAKVAIQVTSDGSLDKIKESLKKIIKYGLHEKYDRFIFYILTRKQNTYSEISINKICRDKIVFDVSSDIQDYTDLTTIGAKVSPLSLKRAVDIIGSYMRGCDVGLAEQDFDPPKSPLEMLSVNLLEVYFPPTLYIANLLPEVLEGKKAVYQRKSVIDFVISQGCSVPSDFEVSAGRLITFRNLEDSDNSFEFLIDKGTAEPFSPSDFYEIDKDHEHIFKSLLRFSLQQKLERYRVSWNYRERMFIFLPLRDSNNVRKETWLGQKRAERTVFERKFMGGGSNKVLSTKHFAFHTTFLTINNEWFMSITPDWFFSYSDEYVRSTFGGKLISGRKKMENNRAVFNQYRFLCFWLEKLDSEDMFSKDATLLPQITFGKMLKLEGGRYLNEDLWKPLVIAGGVDDKQWSLDLI